MRRCESKKPKATRKEKREFRTGEEIAGCMVVEQVEFQKERRGQYRQGIAGPGLCKVVSEERRHEERERSRRSGDGSGGGGSGDDG